MSAITPLPPAPSIADPANFNTKADAFVAALPGLVTEVNALEASLRAAANSIALPYTFSSTTTDSDPGAGNLRLSAGTLTVSTPYVIRADLVDNLGITRTTYLDTFGAATGTNKGAIRLQKVGDASAFADFVITAVASPSGYRNITATCVAVSSATPFSNNELLAMIFVRYGDTGATGPFASWTQIGSTVTISGSPSTLTFSSIPATYSDLLIVLDAAMSGATTPTISLSADGSNFSGAVNLTTSSPGALRGAIEIIGYRQDFQMTISALAQLSTVSPAATNDTAPNVVASKITGGIVAARIGTAGATFSSGTAKIFGR